MKIVIDLPPVTKKNSGRIVTAGGRPRVLPSKAYADYETAAGFFIPYGLVPISTPVNIRATFYMATRRIVDLVNLEEALLDVLVRYKVIADDNSRIVVSMDGSRVSYDKERPRTEVVIENV